MMKSGDKKYLSEIELYERIKTALESGTPVRALTFTDEEMDLVDQLFLLTSKPVLYAANVSEDDLQGTNNRFVDELTQIARKEGSEVLVICAKIEEEISQLDDEEKSLFLEELGLKESGLNRLIKTSYKLLGLMSFLTAGQPEVRAWTIIKGTKAPQASGKIHSDIERGFIRAEIISYDKLVECGSEAAAKEKGFYRLEGKDYVMQEGDVVNFRFNV
jgi:GTP-binding protein YchF